LHDHIRDLLRIAFRTPFEASQYIHNCTDRRLVVRKQFRRILAGAPRPVGINRTEITLRWAARP
jgi:hypothetical protein